MGMIKLVFVSAVTILAAIIIGRTIHLSRRPPAVTECKANDTDFIPLTKDRLEHFQKAISLQTISRDEGKSNNDELYRFGEYIITTFPNLHKESRLVTWERVNNLSLLYHIKGSDASLKPYLLMAHMDVVPDTNLDKWDAPPFSGGVKDDFIYGRGTIDFKQGVMGILEAVEFLLSSSIVPKRSFYIAFGHDEEIKGYKGARKISQRLAEKGVKELEFISDEGMTVFEKVIPGVSTPVASVGVSEKGYLSVKMSVTMPPGHSSMPPKETSIGVLAKAVQRLEENPHPSMLGYGVETDMFEQLVPEMGWGPSIALSNIWLFRYPLSWFMSLKPTTNAVVRTTTAVTIFNAGIKTNVLPPLAEAIVNHRIHPSQTVKEVVDQDISIINDPRVKLEIVDSHEPHPVASYKDDDLGYQALRTSIKQIWPQSTVVPAIMIGATDTVHYLNFTKNVYRFSPTHMFPGDPERFHGINERISVKNYEQAINFYYHLMRNADQTAVTKVHNHHADL